MEGFIGIYPGETLTEGEPVGKTGNQDPIKVDVPFNVTFYSVDLGNNVVPVNITSQLALQVSDIAAYPPNGFVGLVDLVNGTGTSQLSFITAG